MNNSQKSWKSRMKIDCFCFHLLILTSKYSYFVLLTLSDSYIVLLILPDVYDCSGHAFLLIRHSFT